MVLSSPSPIVHFFIKPETLPNPNTDEQASLKSTHIAKFRTSNDSAATSASEMGDLKQTVNLVSDQFDFSKLLGTFLGSGYSKFSPLDDIQVHNNSVITHQTNCLQELILDSGDSSPTFVFMGVDGASIMSDLLSTWLCPRVSKGWKFYGVRSQRCIFIWRESEENYYHSHSPESFYLDCFRALVNGKEKLNGKLYQYDTKKFTLNRLELGGHQIFLAVEVEAINHDQEMVGVRLHREFSPTTIKRQLLRYWTEWVASGWNGLILGQRDYRGLLQNVQVFTENDKDKLLESSKVSEAQCIRHQSAFLHWVGTHLNQFGPGIVHQFSWSPSDWLFSDRVICTTPPGNRMTSSHTKFPAWFETIHKRKSMLPDANNNQKEDEMGNETEN